MQVNFNNLRRKLINNYSSLIKELNSAIVEEGRDQVVKISTENIANTLDDLRECIVIIGCLEEDGNEDCQCIIEEHEILPSFNDQ